MIKNRNLIVLIALFLGTTLQSCNTSTMYDSSVSFKDGMWNKADTVKFTVPVENIESSYDFILTLRTNKEYMFSNLWIYSLVTAPDGTTSKVAREIPLANPDGSWIGKVSGTLVESSLRFDSKPFPIEGDYTFMFVNATQDESIGNIQDISLRIE